MRVTPSPALSGGAENGLSLQTITPSFDLQTFWSNFPSYLILPRNVLRSADLFGFKCFHLIREREMDPHFRGLCGSTEFLHQGK